MTRPLIAAALLTLLAVSPAFGAAGDIKQVTVFYGDLDLHSVAGQTELKARLLGAAAKLCHPAWMDRSPDSEAGADLRQEIYRACLGRVRDRAIARIDDARQAGPVARN